VAIDNGRDSDFPSSSARFAALIRKDIVPILALYQRSIEMSREPAAAEPGPVDIRVSGARLMRDLAERVRAVDIHGGASHDQPARHATYGQDDSPLGEASGLHTTASFFTIAVTTLARHVEDDPRLLRSFVTAVLALNECLILRVSEATATHTRHMLARIHEARLDERRRIARELHDRLGEDLSVALRRLELNELIAPKIPNATTLRANLTREALVHAMDRVRLITSDLREDPVTSLEKALRWYLDTMVTGTGIQLDFHGDEECASSAVLDETYLIIREAIRNALAHAAPHHLVIKVDIDRRQLHALVEDDGRGFIVNSITSGNAGLASMRERAFLVGGMLYIHSVPGHGTEVELVIPLPGPS
jgi:signal transduction histidine kinase